MAKLKQTFTNGQVIYREGDVSDRAFEVLSGAVEMVSDGPTGDTRVGVARAGEMFGESGLIEGGARENTARAVGAVVVRAILRDSGSDAKPSKGNGSGLMGRLLERFGGKKSAAKARKESDSAYAQVQTAPGLIQRVMDSVQPVDGRIEVRLARLPGDEDDTQGRHIAAAMDRFRDMRVKLLDDTLEIDLSKSLAAELTRIGKAGRRLLKKHDGDLLIWGHVPAPGGSIHLHFVARGNWDERLPGAFSFATDLTIPVGFDDAFGNLLHAVALAATRPKMGVQARLRTMLLPAAAEAAAVPTANLPDNLTPRERAGIHLCHGNVHAAIWAQTLKIEHLEQAFEIYQKTISLLSGDAAAIDVAVAHKHLSAISMIRSEADNGTHHYDEAAAAALAALDTLSADDHPLDWAALHHRLGIIHYRLGFESGDTDVLRRAMRYHRNALQAYSRKTHPNRWAEAMAAFGQAAQVFGEHVKSLEALATAVNACRAVLEVRDRRKKPLAWAAAQNNLGSALFLLGKKARNPDRLEMAIAAFEAALEVYRARKLHRPAAVTEKNLERAQDMIEWYSPDGIPIVDMEDTPVADLTASQGQVRSSQAIEVIE